MKVRELIRILANYPPEADISFGGTEQIRVRDAGGERDGKDGLEAAIAEATDDGQWFMYVDEPELGFDGGAFRRGALQQLFGGASTGLEDEIDHEEIFEASGECEHGRNPDAGCTDCNTPTIDRLADRGCRVIFLDGSEGIVAEDVMRGTDQAVWVTIGDIRTRVPMDTIAEFLAVDGPGCYVVDGPGCYAGGGEWVSED